VTEIPVNIPDGTRLTATLRHSSELADDAAIVLCFSAMGVRASYYRPLAEALCAQGLATVTVDLRGIGTSSVRASRASDFGYREVLEADYPAVVATVKQALPGRKMFALGHSLGGQFACLFAAANPGELAGILLIASCSIYYRSWPFPRHLLVLALCQSASLSAQLLGFFPGHLVRFGGREARRLVRDWAHQGRTGRYEAAGSTLDYEALLGDLRLPILAISFADDTYAPRAAVEHLLEKMPRASTTHQDLAPEALQAKAVGHFGWVKIGDRLMPRIVEWLALQEPSHSDS